MEVLDTHYLGHDGCNSNKRLILKCIIVVGLDSASLGSYLSYRLQRAGTQVSK
jgi:hypothetical protein